MNRSPLHYHVRGESPVGVGSRGVAEAVRELWRFRDLLAQLALRDIKIRYKQAIMGFAWAVLTPIIVVLAGLVVRSAMAFASGGAIDRAVLVALALKALGWTFFAGAVGFANSSLVGNQQLVTKVYFPRAALPVAAVAAQLSDSVIAALAVAVVIPALGLPVGLHWLWIFPLGVGLVSITLGVALIASCANLFFRDVKYLVQVALTFGIFFTPVFYEPEMLGPTGARLIAFNPLTPVLEGLRWSVVEGRSLLEPVIGAPGGATAWSPWWLAYSLGVGLGLSAAGLALFRRFEHRFAEYV